MISGSLAMDRHHMRMVASLHGLHRALAEEELRAAAHAITGLVVDVREHFAFEEFEMQRTKYPDFEVHRREHQVLGLKVMRLCESGVARKTRGELPLIEAFQRIFVEHIANFDRKLGRYLVGK